MVVKTDVKIEVEDDCETGTQGREHTNVGTYSQFPVTVGFVGNENYGPGVLRQGEIQGSVAP